MINGGSPMEDGQNQTVKEKERALWNKRLKQSSYSLSKQKETVSKKNLDKIKN